LDRFKADIRVKLSDNADRYPTEESKVNYIFSLCDGAAKTSLLPRWADVNGNKFESVNAFLEFLDTHFGDPDRTGTAQANIDKLRQKNRDFTTYYTEFAKDIDATRYNEAAKKAALLRGLSNELNNALIAVDVPAMRFADLVSTYTRVDARLRIVARNNTGNRNLDGTFRTSPTKAIQGTTSTTTTTTT